MEELGRLQSMGFSRQEYWRGSHFLLQGIFPTQGSKPGLPYGRHTLPSEPLGKSDCEETKIEKDTYIPLFIATLFTIARTWKQPRCPLTDDCIEKFSYIYTMVYYSAIKRNIFESVLMRWMNLEPIIQSEVRKRKINITY